MFFRRGSNMQTKKQTSDTPNHLTKGLDLKKVFYSLSALLLTISIYPAAPSWGASFGGKLNTVTITDSVGVNSPPTAIINYSMNGDVVSFDGSSSSDSDGSLVSYSWDFGDGTTGTGATIDHQFAGSITPVTLTVIDNSGGAALSQVTVGSAAFSDDFSTDTTGNYTVSNTWTQGGTGKFTYDATGQRLKINTGNDIALQFARTLPASSSGKFALDFSPTKIYPSGGIIVVRLRQDQSNYYEVKYSDGYTSGILRKIVNGTEVGKTQSGTQYKENANYHIEMNFDAAQVSAQGIGSALTLSSNNTDIKVSSVEIELTQQDAYFDNFEYTK